MISGGRLAYEELKSRIREVGQKATGVKEAQKKIARLNTFLHIIQNLSQLISMGKDCDSLLKDICECLVGIQGYCNAWIVFMDKSGEITATAQSGWGKDFLPLLKTLRRSDLPVCGQKALSQQDVVIISEPSFDCIDCPLSHICRGMTGMAVQLECRGKIYGFLCATVPPGYIAQGDEVPIFFKEVAMDIAFALHCIRLSEEQEHAKDALRKANEELERKMKERTAELIKVNEQLNREIGMSKQALLLVHETEKQVREIRTMFQSVFDGISEPLVLLDQNMAIEKVNKAGWDYYKITEDQDVIGKACYNAFRGRSNPCEGCLLPSSIIEGRRVSFERKGFIDPSTVEQVIVNPIKGNKKSGAVIHIVDITKLRQMERELIRADKMISLGVLASCVAHEINNPNNFIMLNAPLLHEAWESTVPILEKYYEENGDFNTGGLPYSEMREELPKLLSGIEDGSKRIKRIVQELKDYTRKDSSDMDMDRSVNINKVIRRAVLLCKNLIRRSTRNFGVEYAEDLPSIRGNGQQLEQVIVNLLQNACQALPDKGRGIFLESYFDEMKGSIVVEVKDEGEGIPEDFVARVMDPFFTTRSKEGGTGLGLSVSLKIVKRHGGTIEVESRRGEGTIFRILFPIAKTKPTAKVLVADDDPVIRELLTAAFEEHERFSVRTASNGAEAFLKMGQDPPDLLILDIQMPDMDGVEVCRLIKETPQLRSVKVVVITGEPYSFRAEKISGMGFNHILPKPFQIGELMKTVEKVWDVKE